LQYCNINNPADGQTTTMPIARPLLKYGRPKKLKIKVVKLRFFYLRPRPTYLDVYYICFVGLNGTSRQQRRCHVSVVAAAAVVAIAYKMQN